MPQPLVIGWKERVDFPEWGIHRVRVKMDTGAKTSVIHGIIRDIRENPDGTRTASLQVSLFRHRPDRTRLVEAPLVKTARIKNTGGVALERFVIETTIRLGSIEKRILVSITNRGRMLSPVLLGRTALMGDFLVDVSQKFILS